MTKLTDTEAKALRGIATSDFMDGKPEAGKPIWSWSGNTFANAVVYSGAVSSLAKKGLVHCSPGAKNKDEDCLSLTDAGLIAYNELSTTPATTTKEPKMFSKTFTVKSNAARAAKAYGLTVKDVLTAGVDAAGKKVFHFEIPAGVQPTPSSIAPSTAPVAPVAPAAATTEGKTMTTASKAKATKKAAKSSKKAAKPSKTTRASGVGAEVLSILKARYTSVADLCKKTGWLPHTLRAFISVQSRALGLLVQRQREDKVTSYKLVPAKA